MDRWRESLADWSAEEDHPNPEDTPNGMSVHLDPRYRRRFTVHIWRNYRKTHDGHAELEKWHFLVLPQDEIIALVGAEWGTWNGSLGFQGVSGPRDPSVRLERFMGELGRDMFKTRRFTGMRW